MCVIVTLKQIADLSGVSRGNVDRVLNHRGGVSEKTAKRVLQIAQTLHYSPSAAGKALAATKKSIHLGMLMLSGQNDNNPFIHEMTACARSKAAQLAEYGVTVDILHSPIGDCAAQLACIDRLLEQGIDGLAIMPVNAPEITQKLRQLYQLEIPVITFNSDIEDARRLAYVGSNYYRAGQTAAGLMGLMTGGHARIGIVSGSPDVLCHTQRIAGFLDAAGEKYPEFEISSRFMAVMTIWRAIGRPCPCSPAVRRRMRCISLPAELPAAAGRCRSWDLQGSSKSSALTTFPLQSSI